MAAIFQPALWKRKKKKKKRHINCSRGNLTYSPPVSWWQSQNSEKPVLWSVLSLCTREERAQSKDKEQTRQVTYPLRDSSTCHVIHLKIMEQWESERQLLSSLVKPLCSWQSRKKTLPSWALEKSTKYRLYVLNYNRAPLGCWAHNRVNRRVGSCPTVPHINQRQYLTFKCVLRTCCCLATRGECIRKPREQTRYKPWQKKKEEKKKALAVDWYLSCFHCAKSSNVHLLGTHSLQLAVLTSRACWQSVVQPVPALKLVLMFVLLLLNKATPSWHKCSCSPSAGVAELEEFV